MLSARGYFLHWLCSWMCLESRHCWCCWHRAAANVISVSEISIGMPL